MILDLILLALLALVVFLAAKRGFMAVVLSLAAWVVSMVLSSVLSAALAPPIYEAVAGPMVRELIAGHIDASVNSSEAAQYAQQVLRELPESLKALAEAAGISVSSLADGLQNSAVLSQNAAQLIEQNIAAPIVLAAIRMILCIVIFVLLLIATRLLAGWLGKVTQLPVLKQADRLAGAVLGLVKGFLLLLAVALALRVVAELLPESGFAAFVEGSVIVRLLDWFPLRKNM
ncbi:MAG: CvpA family protein [Oscillospiraceae bacterium]|nr:CvpA family protein [Oscillospiraceae bacterium]